MNRKLLITVHMYLAAFFAPAVLLVAVSGGLYLLGVKGEVTQEVIFQSDEITIDSDSASLHADVANLLSIAGVKSYDFDYVKVKGASLYTRPTSSDHYVIKIKPGHIELIHAQPDLQSRLIELHKGHGPAAFKTFQQVFALGLVIIILTGLWLGLSAAHLRKSTLLTLGAGAVVFGLLLF